VVRTRSERGLAKSQDAVDRVEMFSSRK